MMESGKRQPFHDSLTGMKTRYRTISAGVLGFLMLGIFFLVGGCRPNQGDVLLAPFHKVDSDAVEIALKSMSEAQKMAQLIIVRASGDTDLQDLLTDASRGMLGGVILRDITTAQHLEFVEKLKKASPFPLFIGTEETGLLNNQFCDATPFPARISLDAGSNPSDKEQIQALFRKQALALHINWSLDAPIYRGAVWNDSTGLPRNNFNPNREALKNMEQDGMIRLGNSLSHWVQIPNDTSGLTQKILRPYRQLAKAGIAGFWIDPAILQANQPRNYLRNYMTNTLGFDGLLVGSGNMEALLYAGADLVVFPTPAAEVRQKALQLLEDRVITSAELTRRVRRVLAARIWSENAAPKQFPNKKINPIFSNADLRFQAVRLWENSATVLQNPAFILPFKSASYPVWSLSGSNLQPFSDRFSKYGRIDSLYRRGTTPQVSGKPLVVLWESNTFPVSGDAVFHNVLYQISKKVPVTLIHFGDARRLEYADTSIAIIQLWERNTHTENAAANILFGAQAVSASLPETIGSRFGAGDGVALAKVRLKYSMPEEAGITSAKLALLDTLVQKAIARNLFPGCQIFVAHQGHIIYTKSLGQQTYGTGLPVTDTTLYDVASLTKIASTTLMTMYLKESGKIRLENTVQAFIPNARGRNGKTTIRQLLNHTSGLPPSLPINTFIKSPLHRRRSCNAFFCKSRRNGYAVQVAEDLYFKNAARQSLLGALYKMPVKSRTIRYGDVNMVILQQILEKAGGAPLDKLADSSFFCPLGLSHITFNPLNKHPRSTIAPTEHDKRWRQQLVHGFVHDRAAALLGGVAGHAGLFSNAEDLGVLFQMLLNGGEYGGDKYLQPETIALFTGRHARSPRGLGFDKPRRAKYPSFGSKSSPTSFGHGGFTGACAWADPEAQLVFVFLSNRIHPNANNQAFFESRVRQKLHDAVYTALNSYKPGWGM